YGIAVDSAGYAYVTGTTGGNLPILNAYQPMYGGGSQDAFVAKLDPSGSLVYATYLRGNGTDRPTPSSVHGPIDVDGSPHAHLAGPTDPPAFPTSSGAAYPAWSSSWGSSGYITEINATGSALVYSTYLPGGPGSGIAVQAGKVYVTGGTGSANL